MLKELGVSQYENMKIIKTRYVLIISILQISFI